MIFVCSVQVYVSCKEYEMCARHMKNRMGLLSTADVLSAKGISTPVLKLGGQCVKSVDQYKYLGILLDTELSVDENFGDNCDINIVQQTSCEPKTYFFVFERPRMHLNYGVISRSHACTDCGWHIILVAQLYTTCPGDQVLVATRFTVTFLPLRLCYVNTSICYSKDAENL